MITTLLGVLLAVELYLFYLNWKSERKLLKFSPGAEKRVPKATIYRKYLFPIYRGKKKLTPIYRKDTCHRCNKEMSRVLGPLCSNSAFRKDAKQVADIAEGDYTRSLDSKYIVGLYTGSIKHINMRYDRGKQAVDKECVGTGPKRVAAVEENMLPLIPSKPGESL